MNRQSVALLGLICLAVPSFAAAEALTGQFIKSCIETLPDFAKLGDSLKTTAFKKSSETVWIRESDSAVFQVVEASDRTVCMFGLPGDQVAPLSTAIAEVLADGKLGRYERKSYQGRTLYLLQSQRGLTIIEVIPPYGATTYLVANAQKE